MVHPTGKDLSHTPLVTPNEPRSYEGLDSSGEDEEGVGRLTQKKAARSVDRRTAELRDAAVTEAQCIVVH